MQVLIQNFVWVGSAAINMASRKNLCTSFRASNTVSLAKDKTTATITALSVVENWDNIADRTVALLYSQGTEQQHQLLLN